MGCTLSIDTNIGRLYRNTKHKCMPGCDQSRSPIFVNRDRALSILFNCPEVCRVCFASRVSKIRSGEYVNSDNNYRAINGHRECRNSAEYIDSIIIAVLTNIGKGRIKFGRAIDDSRIIYFAQNASCIVREINNK